MRERPDEEGCGGRAAEPEEESAAAADAEASAEEGGDEGAIEPGICRDGPGRNFTNSRSSTTSGCPRCPVCTGPMRGETVEDGESVPPPH
ncbi:MAG: hypothetical protein R2911_36880 [Caldilineaceae bacterium]